IATVATRLSRPLSVSRRFVIWMPNEVNEGRGSILGPRTTRPTYSRPYSNEHKPTPMAARPPMRIKLESFTATSVRTCHWRIARPRTDHEEIGNCQIIPYYTSKG